MILCRFASEKQTGEKEKEKIKAFFGNRNLRKQKKKQVKYKVFQKKTIDKMV